MAQQVKKPTSIHDKMGSIPGLSQWVKDLVLPQAAGVGRRCDSDPVWLWLWCRPAAVQLQISPWPGELPYAAEM